MFLSDAELTAMRADVAQMLPKTGYILSISRVSNGQGGFTETWGTAGTVNYRIDPMRGNMSVAGAAQQSYHAYTLTLPYDTALATTQRFRDEGGNIYTVRAVDNGKSWDVSRRAELERV